MIDALKRAWRGLIQAGPFARIPPAPWPAPQPFRRETQYVGDQVRTLDIEPILSPAERAFWAQASAYKDGLAEATAAQKNLRLHSIARERNRLKDEIARLKRNKKRHSHLLYELGRLTRLELTLEGGK